MQINVMGQEISDAERAAYEAHAKQKHPDREIVALDVKVDGDFVDLTYHFAGEDFQRIRRITGYLVGTLDRFNNAKRTEEHDRVKHAL